jgi:hypothetical protein
MNMPIAHCPNCGTSYQGWALLSARHQTCSCGHRLKIQLNDQAFNGYSPFDAEKLILNTTSDAPSPPPVEKDKDQQEP